MAAMATWTASRWLTERHDVLKVYGGFASGPQRNLS